MLPGCPVKNSRGRLYCHEHRRRFCVICRVDYVFEEEEEVAEEEEAEEEEEVAEEEEAEEEAEEEDGDDAEVPVPADAGMIIHQPLDTAEFNARREKAGKSRFLPSVFEPPFPEATPSRLYDNARPSLSVTGSRYVRRSRRNEILIYTDGACSNNGKSGAASGCAFIFKEPEGHWGAGRVSFRLETQGPTGQTYEQTSNRAKLRAAIAALEYRRWDREGWKHVVLATDLEYVALGATQWVRSWQNNGWRTQKGKGTPVKNRDLWERLLDICDDLNSYTPLMVSFWRVPHALNSAANAAAKEAVTKDACEKYTLRQCTIV